MADTGRPMSLRLVPTDVALARRFAARHGQHTKVPRRWLLAAGAVNGDSEDLVGVAIAGPPVAERLCDGYTLEMITCADVGTDDAAAFLYTAMAKAARALGYKRVVTYAESESDTTLRACGWRPVAASDRSRRAAGCRIRWERRFDAGPPPKSWPADS